ncbi:glycosyltransferase family 2 protein [Hamadaea tsunoensis]|uniref:glycosyltransferase family 2 protein n=1 Tax=Hamadaea tsunoensis TaxID=53368 RepID=UPI00146FA915|nr:glycosyltransferase [Hamadaea tsunoensis]
MFTFVIPAHNEQDTVATVVSQALQAAHQGDRVMVVDSASTDGTAGKAAAAGAEVLAGPIGKGAAMNAALRVIDTQWVCFLDADLGSSPENVPALLRAAAVNGTADHIAGDWEYADPGTILSNTFTLYEPLVSRFFPEVAGRLGANSLTGYRAVRRRYLNSVLPNDFGVEAHINITVATAGGTCAVQHLGVIASRFRHKPAMGSEIAAAVLRLAVSSGRLDARDRPMWNEWVIEGVAAIAGIDAAGGRSQALAGLFAAIRRPMPRQ